MSPVLLLTCFLFHGHVSKFCIALGFHDRVAFALQGAVSLEGNDKTIHVGMATFHSDTFKYSVAGLSGAVDLSRMDFGRFIRDMKLSSVEGTQDFQGRFVRYAVGPDRKIVALSETGSETELENANVFGTIGRSDEVKVDNIPPYFAAIRYFAAGASSHLLEHRNIFVELYLLEDWLGNPPGSVLRERAFQMASLTQFSYLNYGHLPFF